MKWTVLIPTATAAALLTFGIYQTRSGTAAKMTDNSPGSFAVLELFTSEGCSSCPSADRLLPELAREDANTFVLSFHVDYWDNLGWKDAFSSAAWTQRQQTYAADFRLQSIYTPQLVVNGSFEMVGSDRKKIESTLANVRKAAATSEIKVNTVSEKDQKVHISCQLSGDIGKSRLVTALVQKHAERKIGAGENSGATLVHTNIVRSLAENEARPDMEVQLGLPADLKPGDWELILYIQKINGLGITGAASYQP